MRTTALALSLLVLLAACGDSEPTVTINGQPVEIPQQGMPAGMGEAFGEKLREASERARAFSERGLVAADVQRYLALMPKWRETAGQPDAAKAMLTANGESLLEWSVLMGRMATLMASIKMNSVSDKLKADADVVRPFMPQIEAALKPPPR